MQVDSLADPRTETRFLPAVAKAIALWFPELEGRSMAVISPDVISKQNIPTLPLVMVGFARSVSNKPLRSHSDEFEIEDMFVIEFWLKRENYTNDKGETPFWSYYPYEWIRDTLLTNFSDWTGPGGERVAYRSLVTGADPSAVMLTFGFTSIRTWCPEVKNQGDAFTIGFGLCTPAGMCVPGEQKAA